MQRTTRLLAVLSVLWLTQACSYLTTRAPTCQLPPPPSLPSDCPNMSPITDPSFGALYQQSLRDAVQYQQCRQSLRDYASLMAYRESVCPSIESQLQSPKPWWKVW